MRYGWIVGLGDPVPHKEQPLNDTDSRRFTIEYRDTGKTAVVDARSIKSWPTDEIPLFRKLELEALNAERELLRTTDADVESFARTSTMWMKEKHNNVSSSSSHSSKKILVDPEQINFMFTRDYNMVEPPRKRPYQIGVQGGFLVIRPNRRDFDRTIEIILTGGNGYTIGDGWGGEKLAYGGYYGAGTIQGLASFYYDYYENATRSVELNRCNYNTMVDNPYHYNEKNKKNICRTTEDECEDCRKTKLKDIYTVHFTVCGKPEWCQTLNPVEDRLCSQLMREWHKTRLSLEMEWMKRFSFNNIVDGDGRDESRFVYVPDLKGVDPTESRQKHLESHKMGHCKGDKYIALLYPATRNRNSKNESITLI